MPWSDLLLHGLGHQVGDTNERTARRHGGKEVFWYIALALDLDGFKWPRKT